jgi:hypothetical protein
MSVSTVSHMYFRHNLVLIQRSKGVQCAWYTIERTENMVIAYMLIIAEHEIL